MKSSIRVFFITIIGTIFLVACNSSDIIPQRDMVKILKKIYLTDGVISNAERHRLFAKDTIAYYEPIIQSYGYSTAQFDSSIKHYAQRTDEFDDILDRVIIELSKMEDKPKEKLDSIQSIDSLPIDSTRNLWPIKTYWDMSIDHHLNPSLAFEVPVKGFGKYTLSFDAQVFPDDKSVDTRLYIFFYNDDKTTTGNRTNPILSTYVKDSVVRNMTYTLELKDSMVTHISGWLYDHGGESKTLKRHAVFSNFYLTYKQIEKDTIQVRTVSPKNLKLRKTLKRPIKAEQ